MLNNWSRCLFLWIDIEVSIVMCLEEWCVFFIVFIWGIWMSLCGVLYGCIGLFVRMVIWNIWFVMVMFLVVVYSLLISLVGIINMLECKCCLFSLLCKVWMGCKDIMIVWIVIFVLCCYGVLVGVFNCSFYWVVCCI